MATTRRTSKPVGLGSKAGASSPPAKHTASAQARRSTTRSSPADRARSAGRGGVKHEIWGRGHKAPSRVAAAAGAPLSHTATRSPAPQRTYELAEYMLAPEPRKPVVTPPVAPPVTRAAATVSQPAPAPEVAVSSTTVTPPAAASATPAAETSANQDATAKSRPGWWAKLSPTAKLIALFIVTQVAGWGIGAIVNRVVVLNWPPPVPDVRILAPETLQLPIAGQTCEQCPHTTAQTPPAT